MSSEDGNAGPENGGYQPGGGGPFSGAFSQVVTGSLRRSSVVLFCCILSEEDPGAWQGTWGSGFPQPSELHSMTSQFLNGLMISQYPPLPLAFGALMGHFTVYGWQHSVGPLMLEEEEERKKSQLADGYQQGHHSSSSDALEPGYCREER